MDTAIVLPDVWVPLVAALIPLLTAAVVRGGRSRNPARALVALGAAGLVAALSALVDAGDATVGSAVSAFLTAVVVQFTSYQAGWKPLAQVNERVLPDRGVL